MESGPHVRDGVVDIGDVMRGGSHSYDDESSKARTHQLGYGRPSYPETDHSNRQFTLPVPVSFLLAILQIPWTLFVPIGIFYARMGQARSVFFDSTCYLCLAPPAIGAVVLAIRRWFSPPPGNSVRFFIFNILGFLCAVPFLLYIFWYWYADLWLHQTRCQDFQ